MILFDFEYDSPADLREAVALLRAHGEAARPVAGGTDLLPNMRIEVARPSRLVSLASVAPEPPLLDDDGALRVDALSRLGELETSELVRERAPMLAEAIHCVASNQIRQMGTLGGNLCQDTRCLYYNQSHDFQFVAPCYKRGGERCYPFPRNGPEVCWSVYSSDTAPALIALDAELEILGEDGARRMPVAQLFTGSGLRPLALAPSELVAAVIIPPPAPRSGWGYHKSTVRGGLEFGMAVMAVNLRLAGDGTCADARIVLGAINEAPVRPEEAERALVGATLEDERLAGTASDVCKNINPLPHHGFSRRHLLDNIRVHLRRTLVEAAARAGQAV